MCMFLCSVHEGAWGVRSSSLGQALQAAAACPACCTALGAACAPPSRPSCVPSRPAGKRARLPACLFDSLDRPDDCREYNHKRGFKCVFERGILHLYFNFQRQRYRR